MENQKTKMAESLTEFLRENQKTVSQVIKMSVEQEEPKASMNLEPYMKGDTNISEILEKMSELIELNRVTLQTIDLLDKRIKRLHGFVMEKMDSQSAVRESVPIEGGTAEYTQ